MIDEPKWQYLSSKPRFCKHVSLCPLTPLPSPEKYMSWLACWSKEVERCMKQRHPHESTQLQGDARFPIQLQHLIQSCSPQPGPEQPCLTYPHTHRHRENSEWWFFAATKWWIIRSNSKPMQHSSHQSHQQAQLLNPSFPPWQKGRNAPGICHTPFPPRGSNHGLLQDLTQNSNFLSVLKSFTCKVLNLWTSLVAQTVKRLPTMRETRVGSLGWEDTLEKEMAPHSSTLAWRIPWLEEPGRLQSMGSQRVRHDWATSLPLLTLNLYQIIRLSKSRMSIWFVFVFLTTLNALPCRCSRNAQWMNESFESKTTG